MIRQVLFWFVLSLFFSQLPWEAGSIVIPGPTNAESETQGVSRRKLAKVPQLKEQSWDSNSQSGPRGCTLATVVSELAYCVPYVFLGFLMMFEDEVLLPFFVFFFFFFFHGKYDICFIKTKIDMQWNHKNFENKQKFKLPMTHWPPSLKSYQNTDGLQWWASHTCWSVSTFQQPQPRRRLLFHALKRKPKLNIDFLRFLMPNVIF